MDRRRALVCRVVGDLLSLSEAAREFGVSRPTARLWVSRAFETGLAELSERSRRPSRSPTAVDEEHALALVAEKERYPAWGAKKLLARLWPGGSARYLLGPQTGSWQEPDSPAV